MVTSTSPTFLLEARSPPDLIPVVSKNTNELKTGSPERFRLASRRPGPHLDQNVLARYAAVTRASILGLSGGLFSAAARPG